MKLACWVFWWRGDPEAHLLGFATKREREAYRRGSNGPFRRILRCAVYGPN